MTERNDGTDGRLVTFCLAEIDLGHLLLVQSVSQHVVDFAPGSGVCSPIGPCCVRSLKESVVSESTREVSFRSLR